MNIVSRTILVSLVIVFSISIKNQIRAQGSDCARLIWFDEFDTAGAPGTDKWDYDTGGGGWGNNELQTYTNNRTNSWVENGHLFIKAVKTNNSWSSARLVTRHKGDWLYGRIEVKAKLPSGKGTWPAIWMLPTDWVYGGWPSSGELDIMEHVGYDPGIIHGTAHTESYYFKIGTQKGSSLAVADAMSAFHVYAIEWDEEKISWFVDDQLYFTFSNEHKTYKEWPFDQRFHLLLNIAIGGDWGGAQGIDPNLTEATMEIDYIRVYNNKLSKPVITGSNINTKNQETSYQVNQVDGVIYNWNVPDGVTIVSGANTNQITVQWNDAPGDIQVGMQTICDTVVSDLFHVNFLTKPETDRLDILPENSEQLLLWNSIPGQNNSLNLSVENQELITNFQVGSPDQNAYIYYNFDGLIDLTNHNELAFDLRIDPTNPPSNMRIDLVDVNGNVKLTDLFKIEQIDGDDQFHTYNHTFSTSTDGSFLLNKIAQIRIYINYGLFGQVGNGIFRVKNMRVQVPNATGLTDLEEDNPFKIYPNPAQKQVTIESKEAISLIQLYTISGQLLISKTGGKKKRYQLTIDQLNPGIYLLNVNQKQTEKILVY